MSAAHEFGHMIGLMDEYYAAGSVDTVKHMISDGLLPPDTPEDHFTQGQKDASSEAAGQAATTGMLQANDLPSPDYTQAAQAKSTSLMSGGFEVTAQHHVTIWEALAQMTAGAVGGHHWKIG